MAALVTTSRAASTVFGLVLLGQSFAACASASALALALSDSADTIRALDTDGNGRVSLAEIESFAQKNGISAAEIRSDFNDLDSNHDGELDAQEIGGLFAAGSDDSASAVSTDDAKAPAEASTPAKAVSPPAANPAVAKAVVGSATSLEELEAQVSRQAGGVLAEGFARSAEARMKQGEKDEKAAASFEAAARSLRGKIQATTKEINAETRRVAEAAAVAAAKPGLEKARQLNQQAEKLERTAAEHRSRATQALHNAMQAQTALSSVSSHAAARLVNA